MTVLAENFQLYDNQQGRQPSTLHESIGLYQYVNIQMHILLLLLYIFYYQCVDL